LGTAVERIAKKFGGQAALARELKITRSAVCHWNRPRDAGGRDGSIPDVYHAGIIAAAKRKKLGLKKEELINV
jgi:hypothetical protein